LTSLDAAADSDSLIVVCAAVPTGVRTIWIDLRPIKRKPAETLTDFAVCGEGISPATARMSTAQVR